MEFIQNCFAELGISKKLMNWTMTCIMIMSLSPLINGIPGKPYRPERGIRQGNPISYIFLLFLLNNMVDMLIL